MKRLLRKHGLGRHQRSGWHRGEDGSHRGPPRIYAPPSASLLDISLVKYFGLRRPLLIVDFCPLDNNGMRIADTYFSALELSLLDEYIVKSCLLANHNITMPTISCY